MSIKDKLKPGNNWATQIWLNPHDNGDRCLVYIVVNETSVRDCVGNMSMKDAIAFSNGFYRAMQELIDQEEDGDDE